MEIVGQIHFDGYSFNVYSSLEEPLFLLSDVIKIQGRRYNSEESAIYLLEEDEYIKAPIVLAGQRRTVYLITELGLYNLMSQSDLAIARKWRRIVHSNLIMMRKQRELTIEGQFEDWNAMVDDLYIDPKTGILMQSVTVAGGDVEQVPYGE